METTMHNIGKLVYEQHVQSHGTIVTHIRIVGSSGYGPMNNEQLDITLFSSAPIKMRKITQRKMIDYNY